MSSTIIKYPLCPHCKTELEYDETYNIEYDEDGIVLYVIGHCSKCEKDYQWQQSACRVQLANTDLREC